MGVAKVVAVLPTIQPFTQGNLFSFYVGCGNIAYSKVTFLFLYRNPEWIYTVKVKCCWQYIKADSQL